MSSKKTSNP